MLTLQECTRRAGAAGRGAAKRRGDTAYYRALAQRAWAIRRARKLMEAKRKA